MIALVSFGGWFPSHTANPATQRPGRDSGKAACFGSGTREGEERKGGQAPRPLSLRRKKPMIPRTLHQRHTHRPVQCRHCGLFFLETQNHATACAYHPGEYKVACPAWCPGLTPKCSAHRAKRWSCWCVSFVVKLCRIFCFVLFKFHPRSLFSQSARCSDPQLKPFPLSWGNDATASMMQ